MTADLNNVEKKSYTLTKLSKCFCPECGGILLLLDKGEIRKLRMKLFISEIFKCPDCENIFAINKTLSDDAREWREELEDVGDLIIPESEFVSNMINDISPAIGRDYSAKKPRIFSLGRIYKCGGQGIGCELYYLASSGVSEPGICGSGKRCQYDPYIESHKQLEWLGSDSKNFIKVNPIFYWKNKIKDTIDLSEKIDAVKRLGSLRTLEVKDFLLEVFKNKKENSIVRQIAAERLSHFKGKNNSSDETVVKYFADVIFTEGEKGGELIETILFLVRTKDVKSTESLIRFISLLCNHPTVGKSAIITMRVIQKKVLN